jgi:glucose/arabinose dehydrogenase
MKLVARYVAPTALFAVALGVGASQSPSVPPQVQTLQGQKSTAPAGGRGFGGLRASIALFNEQCSGCHGGIDGTGGRAPDLFNEKWLKTTTDEQIAQTIRNGIPNSEMEGFPPAQLTDQQIFELVSFLRTQSGNVTPKPEFVADPVGKVITSEKQKFKIEVVARGLDTPWGMVFLPDGRLLITERPGRLRIFSKGKLSDPVKGMPVPRVFEDAGYLDVTVHPRYVQTGWIYLAYAEVLPGFTLPPPDAATAPEQSQGPGRGRGPQIPSNTVIVRGKINKANQWTDQQLLFRSPANLYPTGGAHFGCRFLWDKQGHLFFTLGERGNMKNAQDLMNNPLGKIHRVNDDGSVPKDNPFVNARGADPTIWSYGHRNPQGLTWDPVTGKLWESEHGPTGGDEINIIEPGRNYGWGVISMGVQPGITERTHEGMEQPIVYYTPAIAPSGISFYTGDRYPGWKNTSLFVCGLRGQQLRRLEISGDKVAHQEVVFSEFGRVRDIVQGPDGYFYLALQNPTGVNGLPLSASTPGLVIRLIPAR